MLMNIVALLATCTSGTMLGLATTAAIDSLQLEAEGPSSAGLSSTSLQFNTVSREIVSMLSRCCGLSPKLVSDVSLLSASVLPAVATLCIVRVSVTRLSCLCDMKKLVNIVRAVASRAGC
jgi:hypothetical protein